MSTETPGSRSRKSTTKARVRGARLRPPVAPDPEARDDLTRETVWNDILDRRRDGMSLAAIAKYLNDKGTPSPSGKKKAKWYASTVRSVLKRAELDAEAEAKRDATTKLAQAVKGTIEAAQEEQEQFEINKAKHLELRQAAETETAQSQSLTTIATELKAKATSAKTGSRYGKASGRPIDGEGGGGQRIAS